MAYTILIWTAVLVACITLTNAAVTNIECVDTVQDSLYSGWGGGLRAETPQDLPSEINPGRLEGHEGFIYLSMTSDDDAQIVKTFDINRDSSIYLYLKYSTFVNASGSGFTGYLGPILPDGTMTALEPTVNYEWREEVYALSADALLKGFRPTVGLGSGMKSWDHVLIDTLAIVYGTPESTAEVSAVCPGVFKVECFDDANFESGFENGYYAATAQDLPDDIRDMITGTGIYYTDWSNVAFRKRAPLQPSYPAYVYTRFSTVIGTFGGLSPMGSPAADNADAPFIRNIHFFANKPTNYNWAEEVFQFRTESLGNEVYPLNLGGYERISGGNYFLVDKLAIVYGTPPDVSNIWELCPSSGI